VQGYEFRKVSKVFYRHKEGFDICHMSYVFTAKNSHQYIVNVEHHPYDVYAVKFYYQGHKQSKYKFNLLTNQGDARRIIFTCINIARVILDENPLASFAFVGAPTRPELKQKRISNTKRYRVYLKFALTFFAPINYSHALIEEKSACLLLNKKKLEKNQLLLVNVIDMFERVYNFDELYRD